MIAEQNLNLASFNTPEAINTRFQLLGKIAEIGDWYCQLSDRKTVWSDYLYEFYEVDRNFSCSILLEHTNFYDEREKLTMSAMLQDVLTHKVNKDSEFKVSFSDGRVKWHRTVINPVLNESGKLIGLYGVLHNITNQKQLNIEKENQHALFTSILQNLPTELFILNKEGNLIFSNKIAHNNKINQEISVDPINVKQQKFLTDFTNAPKQNFHRFDVIDNCLNSKETVTVEENFLDNKGIEKTVLRNIFPLLNEKGEVDFLVGHGVEISAIKKTEMDLQRMAIVAEKTNGIVMVTDANRRITWVNNSFERILGYQIEEVIGRDPADFLQGPETSQQTIKQIAESLKKTGAFSGEILNYTKSGKKIWLYLDIASVYDNSGQLINYVAVENDITVVKLAEEKLQKSIEKERELNQFKTQFVNIASHQFRTPLATIRSSIDLLDLKTQSEDLNSDFKNFLFKHKEIMAEEVLRMTELMESVLDIGRIDEGKIEIVKKPLSFKKFMDDFVRSNQERTGEFRKLKYHFDAENRKVAIDKIILQNILRNIVSNAFKYSQGKSAPELTVNFANNTYFVTVKDYGIGVPQNEQTYLFESFFRASNARNYHGTGLGLMIAKKLTSLHGGNLHFSSEIGKGSSVIVELPA